MQFQILGPLRVTDGDQRALALGGAKPAALLAMLLLRPNELVPSDRLIEELWEGRPPATAAKTLQVHISRLRNALGASGDAGGPIETTSGGYLLHVSPDDVDALRFERLVSEGRAAIAEGAHARASGRLRDALALWRGEALADFAYASFAQDEIARLDGMRTVALESAVEAELALGRHAEVIPELKFLVKRHPLSEHLRAQLMLALYRAGRQAEAVGVYRVGRRILVDQLGIEPGEELRQMERAILAQDAQLDIPAAEARPRVARREQSSRGALVGYDRELSALEDLLEDAVAGRGSVALLAGEAGVGKTRLADELSSVASARAASVVWGRCRSGADAPAYWPWIQVLRTLTSDRDPQALRADLGWRAAELAQLLPELRDILPDVPELADGDASDTRFRLFDAVTNFVKRCAAGRPLVIVLDDLHVADQATLALLEFAALGALEAPMLLVGTYRDTEADLSPALKETISRLARTTDPVQLVLTGLSVEDTAHFVEVSAGVEPMPRLAAAVHETSGGNPLFVSELVRLLRTEDRLRELGGEDTLTLPRGVDQVIARRLDRLSQPCREMLTLAAVIGRDFELTLLERAGGHGGDALLEHLDDAIAARVVELAPGGSFRFTHDLVRQSFYASLAPGEQRRLHAAVGRALERLHAGREDSVVGALAHHFASALPVGDVAKAIHYLRLAGDAASELPAPHEAAAYYQRAAELGRTNEMSPGPLCDLYLSIVHALVAIPDPLSAKAPLEEAVRLAAEAPDRERDGRLAVLDAHMRLLDTESLDEQSVFDAIELFRELDDPAAEAQAWSALVAINCGQSKRLKGGEASERMLECAKRAGSRPLAGLAMRSMASNFVLGSVPLPEAIPRVRALIADAPDAATRARMMSQLGALEGFSGRFDEARALLAQARELCPPRDRPDLEGLLIGTGAILELIAGNHARAVELARVSVGRLEERGLVRYLSSEICFLVDALIGLGRLEEAEMHLERAAPWAAADDVDALMRQVRSRARLALARGNLDDAEENARRALGYLEAAEAVDEQVQTLLLLATILQRSGRDEEARAAVASALPLAEKRGHVPFAQEARDLLATPAAAAVA